MKFKKMISLLSVLTMLSTMGMNVSAESITDLNQTSSQYIKAVYQNGTVTAPEVFSVDIEWGSMEFTYDSGNTQSWNVDTLKYDIITGTSSWTCEDGANKVTITNNSNFGIQADLSYSQKNDSNIDGTFDKSSMTLDKYVDENSQISDSATLSLSGDLTDTTANKAIIGEVTATISGVPLYEVSSEENNYQTVQYTSTDGKTYTCWVYSSTPKSAVLVSTEFYAYAYRTGVLGYDNQVADLQSRGGRMAKFEELSIITAAGVTVGQFENFNCQEYEVAWVSNGQWKYQSGNNKYDDSCYMAVFDVYSID